MCIIMINQNSYAALTRILSYSYTFRLERSMESKLSSLKMLTTPKRETIVAGNDSILLDAANAGIVGRVS